MVERNRLTESEQAEQAEQDEGGRGRNSRDRDTSEDIVKRCKVKLGDERPPWKPGETNDETAARYGVRLYTDKEIMIWRKIGDEKAREAVNEEVETIKKNRAAYYEGLIERRIKQRVEGSPEIRELKARLRALKSTSRHRAKSYSNAAGKLTRDPSGNPMGRPRKHPLCMRYGSHRFNPVTGVCPCRYVRPAASDKKEETENG